MISTMSTSGHTTYGIKEFVLDSPSDIQDLPVDCAIGSTAFVISTGDAYMINSHGEWVII